MATAQLQPVSTRATGALVTITKDDVDQARQRMWNVPLEQHDEFLRLHQRWLALNDQYIRQGKGPH